MMSHYRDTLFINNGYEFGLVNNQSIDYNISYILCVNKFIKEGVKLESLYGLKTEGEDLVVEYEIISPISISDIADPMRRELALEIQSVDKRIEICQNKVAELNTEIDRLTNHADGLDYTIAVASGILTGLLDSFFVGEFNPNVEEVVKKYAKKKGISGDNYEQIIKKLEDKYKVPNDSAYKKKKVGVGGITHRLDDLAHHPSLLGLIASILAQFTGLSIYSNRDGKTRIVIADMDKDELIKVWCPVIISGVLIWLVNMAEKNCDEYDEEIPDSIKKVIKLLAASPAIIDIIKCVDRWKGHLMSDVGTSSGIPGVFLSLLKELSMIPPINMTKLPEIVMHLYTQNKMDLGTELAVFSEIKKQAMPVLLNELIVRSFYFIRHLIEEYKKESSFECVDWNKVIPMKNRTITRMLTIATGTFTAVDMADAAIRSAVKSGGNPAAFATNFVLRINFVGVGRFAVAVATDIGMGIQKGKLQREKVSVMSEEIRLLNAKVYYKCAEIHYMESDLYEKHEVMWIQAEDTANTLNEAYEVAEESIQDCCDAFNEMQDNLERISQYKEDIDRYNPGLSQDIINILQWGEK